MVAVDTNVLVRLLMADDLAQLTAARHLFDMQTIYIADTVLLETEWVLRAAYQLKRVDICNALRNLCGLPQVKLSNGARIAKAIDWHANGLDFSDAMHLVHAPDQTTLKTFDKAFIKSAAKHTDRQVELV